MYSIFILVVLETFNFITDSSASEAVILLSGILENDIWWPIFHKYTAETICIFLEGIVLSSMMIIRVERKEATSRQKWFRDSR